MTAPEGLAKRGAALWEALTKGHALSPSAGVLAVEACRLVDRLDKLDALLRGDVGTWVHIRSDDCGDLELHIDAALSEARQQAGTLRQIVATLEELTPKENDEPSDGLARLLAGMSSPLRN